MVCKVLTSEVSSKKHVKRFRWGLKSCIDGVLGGSGSILSFEQRKAHWKLINRHAGQLFGSGRRIIWDSNKIVKTEIGSK
jgi:hypothetical protein